MAGDHKFYYDFEKEIKLSSFEVQKKEENILELRTSVILSFGDYIFLAPADSDLYPTLRSLRVNGKRKSVTKNDAFYVDHEYPRFGKEITLLEGENEIVAELSMKEGQRIDNIPLRLLRTEFFASSVEVKSRLHSYPTFEYIYEESEILTERLAEGIGKETSPGRFGFTKGDGLLDCAMPALGVVDKMFLCGQPKYQKPNRWSYSLIPEGMSLHASFEPKDVGIEDDDITVNHLSVRWSAKHNGNNFTCTYSLASPAILTEYDRGEVHLGLRYAGNYTSILIPRTDGILECPLDCADISSMAENWLLLFNSTEFPDVPLMLVFDRKPEKMAVKRDEVGRLLSVDFCGTPLVFTLTPFGIERFDPFKMPVEAGFYLFHSLSLSG